MPYPFEKRVEIFMEKMKEIYPRGNVDFSKFVYVNSKTPGLLIDHDLRPDGTEYGEYWQTPSNMYKGQEHPDKRADKISRKQRMPIEEMLKKCREAHPDENLEYFPDDSIKNLHSFIRIVDHDLRPDGTEYGEYTQEINSHIKGHGHPQKAIDKNSMKQRHTTEEFIEMVKKVHQDRDYDYSEVVYDGYFKNVTVICNKVVKGKKHGPFQATPNNLLKGKGCPRCGNKMSKAEDEIIEYLTKKGLHCEHGKRGIIGRHELDIYVPSMKIAIEYNGLKWHSEEFGKTKDYHLNKTLKCEEVGVKLIHVFEDEWLEHKELVLDKIGHILQVGNNKKKIGARKCVVREIDKNTAEEFLEQWHLQGFGASTIYYGSYHCDVLLGVMTFKHYPKTDEWELTRFAVNGDYLVPGLGGKMFSKFVQDNNPTTVKSFADRRWTIDKDNNLYTKLGFTLSEIGKPNYWYVTNHGFERKHKFGFRKNILHEKYGVPLEWTEKQMCDHLGFFRIWDCGLYKYVWQKQKDIRN